MHSKKFLEEIRNNLLNEKARLEKELAKFARKNPHVSGDYEATFPEYGDEEEDNVQEIEQYNVNKPLELNLENLLRDVKKALEKIEKGSYGTCKYCNNEIDDKRLKARPTSNSCVSCKKTITFEA